MIWIAFLLFSQMIWFVPFSFGVTRMGKQVAAALRFYYPTNLQSFEKIERNLFIEILAIKSEEKIFLKKYRRLQLV